ncbi:MAG: Gfo/Idh/MocA family oxidoreductase [Algicola sp.]|nr:Gfo/Idh/MocA family oxidoreductase [Algicola sp.]
MNKPTKTVRIGIVGAGSMGRNHVRIASSHPIIHCAGVYDPNDTVGREVANVFGVEYFGQLNDLLDACEAVVIASPTSSHFEIAKAAIEAGKHCLIEKPITVTVEEGEELIRMSEQHGTIIQVGHVERYNPVFPELKKICEQEDILAINSNRLSYNVSRANDVDVVLDLMIHDLDAINQILGGNLEVVGASGGCFHSPNYDHVSAELMAPNGSVATVIASKVSQTKYRMLNISCSDCYIKVDFLRKEIEINRRAVGRYISDLQEVTYKQEYLVERVFVPNVEPLMAEHSNFVESILEDKEPLVTAYHGVEALRLAIKIQQLCKK